VILQFPSGVNEFKDESGATHSPDSNGQITTTDSKLVSALLSAGFTFVTTNALDGTYNFYTGEIPTSGMVSSMTILHGRLTAITVVS
jgi:hypothetical protein